MRRSFLFIVLRTVLLLGTLYGLSVWGISSWEKTKVSRLPRHYPTTEYAGKVNAPEFPDGMQWLNTRRPLFIHQLRGKILLLDFWTYCCINCMHILPDLKRLEKKYANELVVIGVHSAKFTTEQETENIRQAILRYEI